MSGLADYLDLLEPTRPGTVFRPTTIAPTGMAPIARPGTFATSTAPRPGTFATTGSASAPTGSTAPRPGYITPAAPQPTRIEVGVPGDEYVAVYNALVEYKASLVCCAREIAALGLVIARLGQLRPNQWGLFNQRSVRAALSALPADIRDAVDRVQSRRGALTPSTLIGRIDAGAYEGRVVEASPAPAAGGGLRINPRTGVATHPAATGTSTGASDPVCPSGSFWNGAMCETAPVAPPPVSDAPPPVSDAPPPVSDKPALWPWAIAAVVAWRLLRG